MPFWHPVIPWAVRGGSFRLAAGLVGADGGGAEALPFGIAESVWAKNRDLAVRMSSAAAPHSLPIIVPGTLAPQSRLKRSRPERNILIGCE